MRIRLFVLIIAPAVVSRLCPQLKVVVSALKWVRLSGVERTSARRNANNPDSKKNEAAPESDSEWKNANVKTNGDESTRGPQFNHAKRRWECDPFMRPVANYQQAPPLFNNLVDDHETQLQVKGASGEPRFDDNADDDAKGVSTLTFDAVGKGNTKLHGNENHQTSSGETKPQNQNRQIPAGETKPQNQNLLQLLQIQPRKAQIEPLPRAPKDSESTKDQGSGSVTESEKNQNQIQNQWFREFTDEELERHKNEVRAYMQERWRKAIDQVENAAQKARFLQSQKDAQTNSVPKKSAQRNSIQKKSAQQAKTNAKSKKEKKSPKKVVSGVKKDVLHCFSLVFQCLDGMFFITPDSGPSRTDGPSQTDGPSRTGRQHDRESIELESLDGDFYV